jgi:hypothetical protein
MLKNFSNKRNGYQLYHTFWVLATRYFLPPKQTARLPGGAEGGQDPAIQSNPTGGFPGQDQKNGDSE